VPTIFVIHAQSDTPFVKQHVMAGLPNDGYDYWVGRGHLACLPAEESAIAEIMERCQVILAVLSPAIASLSTAADDIGIALSSGCPVIVAQIAALSQQEMALLPKRLWAVPWVTFTRGGVCEATSSLSALLPPLPQMGARPPTYAEPIDWNEEIFSVALSGAVSRHDHPRTESLVRAIVEHLSNRASPYPQQHAYSDLQKLRQDREFELMCRYGEAAIASGTRKDRVRRLVAQGLIETRRYIYALEILQSIVNDSDSSQQEIYEAYGLIGRAYKQRYVDAPEARGAAAMLRHAIVAYETVYARDKNQFWHGVNAASCILRAERDGILVVPLSMAKTIALEIVQTLDHMSSSGPALTVWDCASRIEALLALERYDDAEQALEVYIHHPDMKAFEVSSTMRQFDQILELARTDRGAAMLTRLRSTMERYRAGKSSSRHENARSMETESELRPKKRMIIRLSNPDWDPKHVTDLVIQTRLGNVVTASGSDASIQELLSDTMVTSIEESRPAGRIECVRSIPFIRIAQEYVDATGTYHEAGDSALIAIIDDGIDVLHKAFLDADGNSRIVGIWDQTDTGGTPPAGFCYGAFHDASAISGYLKAGVVPSSLGRNDNGHGTHVASIAGGRAIGDFGGGVASEAKLLIIVSAGNGSIGYSQSHIEALAWIDVIASNLNLPVVVNLSQGMNAGAHDGKSSLEVAFDAFSGSGRKQGRVVVKSAGNERGKGGHARVTIPPDSLETLSWKRIAGADFAERIELWWSSADEIQFRLLDPSGNSSIWVGIAVPECDGSFPHAGPFHLTFIKRHIDNGDSLMLIELGNAYTAAGLGDWRLEIKSAAVPDGGDIHCWIERSQGVPTSFIDHCNEEMTLSIPGTASTVITVGAVDASKPIQVGAFSSYGPTRDGQKKPLICAPGVNVVAAQGGTEDGVFQDSGTSMAAPHVTGAIALLLSRTSKSNKVPSGNQIASALRQKTQNFTGRWDRGQGYGVIDVAALLEAF